MFHHTLANSRALRCVALAVLTAAAVSNVASTAAAQPGGLSSDQSLHFRVDRASQRLEMIVNTSRILTLDKKIPRIQVNNPEVVRATPLSPYQVQLAALRPGVTQVNLWDQDDQVHTVDLLVLGDARELQMLLESQFPNAALKVRPLASSVVLSGFVDRPESVSRIVRMAEDYYPKIINNISVGGVQQVLLHVRVLEVSRSKLRNMGIDWANFNGNDFVVNTASGILAPPELEVGAGVTGSLVASADTLRFGIVDGANAFFGFLETLRSYNLAKLMAEPTLVTVSGRPAKFMVGGEFPILVPGGLGTVSIEYKTFGTSVDFVPIVLGNGNIRLEVRPSVTERDDAGGVNGVPAIRTRFVDTAAEMRAGQTLALAGLVQRQIEAENRGVPLVSDLPWIGAAFRRVEHRVNEVELLVLVTPELVAPMDRCQVPECLPGSFTTTPSDHELYGKGYLEVPKCCDGGYGPGCGCDACISGPPAGAYHSAPTPVYNSAPHEPVYDVSPQNGAQYELGPAQAPPAAEQPQTQYQPSPYQSPQQRVLARPASTRQYDQYNPQSSRGQSRPPSATARPTLIGPVGYDVLD